MMKQSSSSTVHKECIGGKLICDWILENRLSCHTAWAYSMFIGPVNSYTHTLPIHSAITRLGWLVCFSRASFADHANSRLRKSIVPVEGTDQWKVWFSSSTDRDTSLKPSEHVYTYGWHFLDSRLVQTVLAGIVGCPATAKPPRASATPPPLIYVLASRN